MNYAPKKIVIFDLDGTLTPSKSAADPEMIALLGKLLEKKKVAVISGGSFSQFKKQLVSVLTCTEEQLRNLYLFPTCSTTMYRYHEGAWHQEYAEILAA
ncbi:HAD family hydrolase, partial [Candidatus Woesearchaeota archaeon CG_4_10_14_0_8_um_filter_47_5]